MAERTARPCSIEACGRLVVARGWCGAHYRRWHLYGDPLGGGPFQPSNASKVCRIDGCGRVHFARGLCHPHDKRDRQHGDPEGGRGGIALGIPSRVTLCLTDECGEPSRARGLCWSHLNRERYRENPEAWAGYNHERRARLRGTESEKFTPAEIYERDRWTCGLCRKKIRKELRWPHLRSASLDHVLPLSEGGSHTRANAQAAHLGCNLRKGTGGSQQLSLIG
jgi:5-methylcytosine-specific restriction endonuclease McrA